MCSVNLRVLNAEVQNASDAYLCEPFIESGGMNTCADVDSSLCAGLCEYGIGLWMSGCFLRGLSWRLLMVETEGTRKQSHILLCLLTAASMQNKETGNPHSHVCYSELSSVFTPQTPGHISHNAPGQRTPAPTCQNENYIIKFIQCVYNRFIEK